MLKKKLPIKIVEKLKIEGTSGLNENFYTPKRLCSYRADNIREYIRNMDATIKPNLVKKMCLTKEFREFAFIGSEYSAKTIEDALIVLELSIKLQKHFEITTGKKSPVNQFNKTLKFLNANNIDIDEQFFKSKMLIKYPLDVNELKF